MTDEICVIIPVRIMQEHIGACVESLVAQARPGDEVVVIDDGSSDQSAARAEAAGARVIRNPSSAGPYPARNQGVRATTQPYLLFVDARCRARTGLLDAHRALLGQPGTAMSCTNVEIASSRSLAGRITRAQDSWQVDRKVSGGPLDFYPTANLGVTRVAFDAVAGFRKVRSGADADICWRIQAAGLGRIAADRRMLMSWVPRDRLRDLVEQNYRYGKSSVFLERIHASLFAAAAQRAGQTTQAVEPITPPDDDRLAAWGARMINLPFRAGRLRGTFEYRDLQHDGDAVSA